MLKTLFHRGCVLVSELEDSVQHFYRWRRTWMTPPRDRVLDMYALEDRVLFSIAPVVSAAAVQAGAAGTGTAVTQDAQLSAMPAPDQSLVTVHQAQAGQETGDVSQVSDNQDQGVANNSATTLSSQNQDQNDASNPDALSEDRHVNLTLIDDSLQNLDQLMRSLDSNTEVYLYDHRQQSPTDVLNAAYDWAKSNHAEIDSLSILSHGASGRFILGNQWLSLSNLGESAEGWQRLGSVMTPNGEIGIFGCDVADGPGGQDLINNIGRLSGAEVFASVDDTGFKGNWTLEAASATANASAWQNPLNTEMLEQWKYELAPGITVSYIPGLTTTEAGGTASFMVVLNAAPTANVTIGISSSVATEGTVSTSSLIFTTENWNVTQTVIVTGVNDTIIDGDIAYTILTAPAVSTDAGYTGLDPVDISLTNIDNDPGVTVTPASGLTTTEAGGATQFTAVLNSQPTSDVTVTFNNSDPTEGVVYTNNVDGVFTSLGWYVYNWQQGQGGWYYGHASNGDISNYQQLPLSGGSWQNANGVNLMGWAYVPGNNNDSGVIRYVAQETGQFNFSGSFGLQGWSTWGSGATVRFFANGQQVASQAFAGNDTTSFSYSLDVNLKAGDSFDLCLDAGADNNGDYIWINEDVKKHTNSITFTPENWNTPQTIGVMGVDDFVDDGNIPYTITGVTGSSDSNYNGLSTRSVSLTNNDNDVAGVQIVQSGGSTNVTEGGAQDTYTVRLASQPTANVILTLNPGDQLRVSSTTLTFTDANWNTPQTVTVTAFDDLDLEGTHYGTIAHSAASADSIYNGISIPSLTATISDNEGIIVSPTSGLTTTEAGGTAQFSVALTNQPTGNVTFGISSSDTTEGTVSVSSLTFTPTNWDQAQTVTVTGVNDWTVDDSVSYTIITGYVTSTDSRYNNSNPMDVSVTNTDNDVAGVTVTSGDGLTSESGRTAQITAVLTSQPDSDVIIYFNSGDTTEGATITSGGDIIADYQSEYSTAQSQNGWFYGYYVNSSDHTFHQLTWTDGWTWSNPNQVNLWNWQPGGQPGNNDAYAVARYVAEETGSFNINGSFARNNWGDGGDGMTLHIYLNSSEIWSGSVPGTGGTPIAFSEDVGLKTGDIIDFAVDANEYFGYDWFYFPDSIKIQRLTDRMIFTPTNWNVPQAISITGVDDGIVDGNVAYNVGVSVDSSDSHYDNFTVPDVTLTNLETDLPGVQIRQSSGVTNVAEGGATDSYTVRLTSLPTADVIVRLNTDSQLGLSANSLTFTPDNWDSPQTVTASALDDNIANGSRTDTITHTVESDDSQYNGISVDSVTANITDKTPAGITITPIGGSTTTEDGGTTQFSFVLDSLPTSDVTINFSSDQPTESNPFILGDIVANYDTERSKVQGQGSWYYGYSPYGNTISFTPMTLSASQNWTPDGTETTPVFWTWGAVCATSETYMPVLQYVAEESGTFRIGGDIHRCDWFGEGPHGDGVTLRLLLNGQQVWTGSTGAVYDPNGVPLSVDVTMNQGDHLDFAVDKNGDSGYDAAGLSVYVQKLNHFVTFNRSNWNMPQIVNVKGLNDSAADGDVPYTISGAISTSDTHYSALSAPEISLVNIDNDAPRLLNPSTQYISTAVTFSSENGNAIVVQNVDTRINPLHVQLTAANGQMTLGNTAGLTFIIGNGTANTSMEFLGSADAVNNALEGMTFTPTSNTGSLQIGVNLQGNTVSSDPLVSAGYIGVEVAAPAPKTVTGLAPVQGMVSFTATAQSSSSSLQSLVPSNVNSGLTALYDQFGKLGRTEAINGDKINDYNTLLHQVELAQTTPGDIGMNQSMAHNRYQTLALQSLIPKLSDDNFVVHNTEPQYLWKDIKAITDPSEKLPWLSKISVGTALGVGAGLSAGYVMMVFRCGALLTSSLVTFPAMWQWVDPLPILELGGEIKIKKQTLNGGNDQDENPQLDEDLETIMS